MFLGEELTGVLDAIENDSAYKGVEKNLMEIGATVLPHIPRDTTDRNRTSPFAFTGNKFEFRMLGSAFSISGPNIILNTIVAESLKQFADILEKSKNFKDDLTSLIKRTIKKHKRIIFNGNNYSTEWVHEAKKRGLLNLKTTVDALPYFICPKNEKLFIDQGVLTKVELHSRYEILLENYSKTIHIEALTMIELIRKYVIPSVLDYQKKIIQVANGKKAIDFTLSSKLESKLLSRICDLADVLHEKLENLENSILKANNLEDTLSQAEFYRDTIIINMESLRNISDQLEMLLSKESLSLPTYTDMLYSV